MPRINQYTRQIQPRQLVNVRTSSGAFGSTVGQAMDNLGKTASQVMDKIENIQKKRDKAEYVNKLAAFKVENLKSLNELRQQEFENPSAVMDSYQKNLEERAASLEIPETMRDEWTTDFANMQIDFAQKGIIDQARRVGEKAAQDYENTTQSLENMVALDPSRKEEALQLAEQAVESIPDAADRIASKEATFDRIKKSHATSTIIQDPDQFLIDAQEGKYKDLPNLSKFVETAKEQKKLNKALLEKEAIAATEADIITQIENENNLHDVMANPEIPYNEKIAQVNRLDLTGQVRDSFAVEARRYLKSEKELTADTNSDLMADIVTQIYDLNSISELNDKDYLEGIHNIKTNIMSLRANGELSREDEEKLNNQIRTLTAAKVSGATQMVSYSFGEANEIIQETLPPELRGMATRRLFYRVDKEVQENGLDPSRVEERNLYKKYAREVIDNINQERRGKALRVIESVRQPMQDQDINTFLESKGYTMRDVQETAEKYNMEVEQVIQMMRAE